MRILIEQILSCEKVIFSSEFGKGISVFKGNDTKCKKYDVEIDIEDNLFWGQSIKQSNQKLPLISMNAGIDNFVGILESIDADGYCVLRMGNSIIPFWADGNAFEIGSMIELRVKNVIMTPYD